MKKMKQNPVIASKILAWQKSIFSEAYLDLKFERLLGCFDVAGWKEFLKYVAFRSQEGIEPFAMNLENPFSFECLIERDQENPFETMFSRFVRDSGYREMGTLISKATNELLLCHIDTVPFIDAIMKFSFFYLGGTFRTLGSLPTQTLTKICESESTSDIAKLRALLLLGQTYPSEELFHGKERIGTDAVRQKTKCAQKQWRETILSYRERFKGNTMLVLGLLCLFVKDKGNYYYGLEESEKWELLTHLSGGLPEKETVKFFIQFWCERDKDVKTTDVPDLLHDMIIGGICKVGIKRVVEDYVPRCTEEMKIIVTKCLQEGYYEEGKFNDEYFAYNYVKYREKYDDDDDHWKENILPMLRAHATDGKFPATPEEILLIQSL